MEQDMGSALTLRVRVCLCWWFLLGSFVCAVGSQPRRGYSTILLYYIGMYLR